MNTVIFGKHNSISYNTHLTDYTYRVTAETSKQNLSYTLEIKSIVPDSGTFSLLKVQAHNFRINGKKPDLVADELAHACGEPLYPLLLSVSTEGEINKIHNYAELAQRWNTLKGKLHRYYIDAYSQNYLKQSDEIYDSEALLNHKVKNSPFFFLYFGGIYHRTFGEDLYWEYIREYKGIEFAFSRWVDVETDDKDCFSVYMEGIQPSKEEKIDIQYVLNNQDKSIEKAFFTHSGNNHNLLKLQIERINKKTTGTVQTSPEIKTLQKEEQKEPELRIWLDEKEYKR